MMRLGIYLPTEIYWQAEQVAKVNAEGLEGAFTLLPRHIDYVSVLVPGIMTVTDQAGQRFLFAVDEGTLVKQGGQVTVSTRNCVRGTEIATLSRVVDERFRQLDDLERQARTALTGLEHTLLRRFAELKRR